MDSDISWMFEFESDSLHRISKAVNEHAISLDTCAEIIELIAPAADLFTASGVVGWLKDYLGKALAHKKIYLKTKELLGESTYSQNDLFG